MEQYLNPEKILYYPVREKYRKTTYGGAKVFVKQSLINQQSKKIIVEFVLHKGHWSIDKDEQKRVLKLKVNLSTIKKIIINLNKIKSKKPVNLKLTKSEYKKLYYNYPDADKLGYYQSDSPEYIRVKDILKNIQEQALVYDAGCNSGGIGKILIEQKKCKVFGSEISPNLAKKAKDKGITVFCGWAEKTPFPNSCFDYVIVTFLIEHVLEPNFLIEETLRLLKRGGQILGHVPTEYGDWGKKTIGRHPEHLRAYNVQELKNLLKQFKLTNIAITKEKLIGRRIADYYFFKAKK